MDISNAVQQGDPSVRVDIQPGRWWMLPHPDSGVQRLARKITGHRAFQAMGTVVTALCGVGGSVRLFCSAGRVFRPGQGKPTLDAIVTHTSRGQIEITLVAAYPADIGR